MTTKNDSNECDCTHPDHIDGVPCEDMALGCRADCVCCMGTETLESLAEQTRTSQLLRDEVAPQHAAAERAAICVAACELLGDDTIRHARPSDLPPSGVNELRCE